MLPESQFATHTCGAHYVITDQRSYGCSSFHDGRACSNGVRVRRDRAEVVLPDPIRKGLLSPERVERMAKEMRAAYVEHLRALQMREAERPQELQELTARIERLRARLNRGDPDMTPDEIQAAIERAEAKARELRGLEGVVNASDEGIHNAAEGGRSLPAADHAWARR